jgi:death-on-curing protein
VTDRLTVTEVLAIHSDQIERYVGSSGLRDPGQLEAALFRRQTGYYADLIEEAAALWESLSQNRPFVDGNKRVAFAATYTFLAINGLQMLCDPDATYRFMIDLYERQSFNFEALVAWLRLNGQRAP